jgi:hypothetical protein
MKWGFLSHGSPVVTMGFNTKSSSNDLEDLDHHDEMDTSVDQVGLPKP